MCGGGGGGGAGDGCQRDAARMDRADAEGVTVWAPQPESWTARGAGAGSLRRSGSGIGIAACLAGVCEPAALGRWWASVGRACVVSSALQGVRCVASAKVLGRVRGL